MEYNPQCCEESPGIIKRPNLTGSVVDLLSVKEKQKLCDWLLTTEGHNMAAVFVDKFPGDSFLHNLLHLSTTQQMLDDSFAYMMPRMAHKQRVSV